MSEDLWTKEEVDKAIELATRPYKSIIKVLSTTFSLLMVIEGLVIFVLAIKLYG